MMPVRALATAGVIGVTVPGLIGTATVLSGRPLAGAALLVLSVSLALNPRWRALPAAAPAAFTVCVASVAFVAEGGGLLGLRPLGGPWSARLCLGTLGLVSAVVAGVHRSRVEAARPSGAPTAGPGLWVVPGVFMGLLALVPA